MGKRGNTRKKKGMLLAVVMLLCAFLTGCGLLDIRDGGSGMTNPDYNPDNIEPEEAQPEESQPEEESTTSEHAEFPDLGEPQKEGMAERSGGSIWCFISGLYARLQLPGKRISKN